MDINGHTPLYEDYVSFETAKLLKEKGFNETCFALYNTNKELIRCGVMLNNTQVERVEGSYSAPTHQMALKYLRKTYKIHFEVLYRANKYEVFIMTIEELPKCICRGITGKTYEKAIDKALNYCLTNLIK